ncbi:MAG TPA: class I lanthipeptide [Candidatus Dormibacteraeota bacterium]|jgi:hypothetical protein|nr:class I lanthipeptide [Candidatus Dormibacteraeota bacterium]
MTKKFGTLVLNRETVRNLDSTALGAVAGGTGDVCNIQNAVSTLLTPATAVATAGAKAATDAAATATQIVSLEIGGCQQGTTVAIALAGGGSC